MLSLAIELEFVDICAELDDFVDFNARHGKFDRYIVQLDFEELKFRMEISDFAESVIIDSHYWKHSSVILVFLIIKMFRHSK